MPFGIIFNGLAVLIGGLMGKILKDRITINLKNSINLFLSFAVMTLGIVSIIKLDSIVIVILAFLVGSLLGELLKIDERIRAITKKTLARRGAEGSDEDKIEKCSLAIMIFLFSGTGVFGALTEGMTGDSSVLLAKSCLDIFTATIFATSIGLFVCALVIPQAIIFLALYFLAGLLSPFLTEKVVSNFVAVGGLLTLITGFNLLKLKEVKVLNSLPALILAILLSLLPLGGL